MNWRRVAVFTGVMFAATAAAAFPFGFMRGLLVHPNSASPLWITGGQALAVLVAAGCVFAALAAREPAHSYEHAWAVWAASMVLSLPINVALFGESIAQWAGGSVPLAFSLFVGVPLGRRRAKSATPCR